MLVLGFNGGPDLIHENLFGFTSIGVHDSACVLLEDGEVVFAIEEERLNRIKHTNKFPKRAMDACLAARGVRLSDIDLVAYYSTKQSLDFYGKGLFLRKLDQPALLDGPGLMRSLIGKALHHQVDPSKLRFIHHHLAHAASAYGPSGFDEALVVTIDALGENSCGTVMVGEGPRLKPVVDFPAHKSLGFFYLDVIAYLGFKPFDEYKVMGLAPYGDPERLRDTFKTFYTLLPQGDYEIHRNRLYSLFDLFTPRRPREPITQLHKDVAAALQEALEQIVVHVVCHHSRVTKQKNLCLAGGVAHNCTLNGKLLRSGMFENVFVQPAAHDAGAALGSALCAYYQAAAVKSKRPPLRHLYWGSDVGDSRWVESRLARWTPLVAAERSAAIHEDAARLLAEGAVIGWVQGRSEFGPRALGNRSILADPRPAENKTRINAMVKKREEYRPFAPSVLAESASEFFEVPADHGDLSFMIFVVPVKPDKRQLLGAVTHVDGTARVQSVSRDTNPDFWRLIAAFRDLTGVPVLLNTSFNNNAEPIVDSVDDAVVCYLTTQLDYLIVGDYIVRKTSQDWRDYLRLKPLLPAFMTLNEVRRSDGNGCHASALSLQNTWDQDFQFTIGPHAHRVLHGADGHHALGELVDGLDSIDEPATEALVRDMVDLWSRRLIALHP
jgi:carbamoyltransferase